MESTQSLASYAAFILNDTRVKKILQELEVSNRVADRLKSTLGEEERFGSFYRERIEDAKRQSLLAIVEKTVPARWLLRMHNMKDVIAGRTGADGPKKEDTAVVMFLHFLTDVDFQPYLLTGRLPWFPAPLPKQNQQQFVVALFLWLKMNSVLDNKRRVQYYVKAIDSIVKQIVDEEASETVSTVDNRREFIRLFGDYIHTDVTTADDYREKGKTGTVVRLRFTTDQTGLIVIQTCGDKAKECNQLYKVTENSLAELVRRYLRDPANLPTRPLQCAYCTLSHAAFFHPEELNGFYCNIECYNSKEKI